MPFPVFGKWKKRRQEREKAIKCLISVTNDLLWQLDTIPNSESFRDNWKTLIELDKRLNEENNATSHR